MYQGGAQEVACLNPCSCGGWSQRFRIDMKNNVKIVVLILVLVEDGLRGGRRIILKRVPTRLNPCSCGGWSQRWYSEVLRSI